MLQIDITSNIAVEKLEINSLLFFSKDSAIKKMTSKWAKFKLLMWKNYMLQYRNSTQTILEIIIPVMFSALLVLVRKYFN